MAKNDYILTGCALDLRFDPAFRWWDQAGFVADSLVECDPDLGFNTSQNSTIHLLEPDTGLGVMFGLMRVNVAQQMTDGMSTIQDGKLFFERAPLLAGTALDCLRVSNLQRLGFSCTFRLGTDTLADAVKAWDSSGLARLTPNAFPDQKTDIDIRNLQFYTKANAFEHIQDMRLRVKTEIFELTMTQNQDGAASLSIEKLYKQPSEQRKIRLLQSNRMKKQLADHPPAGIQIELDWFAEFPQKIDAPVLERWLNTLRPLVAEKKDALIQRK